MFNFNFGFSFSLPFWNKVFDNLSCLHGRYAKEVAWELNTYLVGGDEFIKIETNLTTKCDHAGLYLWFALFGLAIEYRIYDTRHWNYCKDCWYLPGEEQEEYEKSKKEETPEELAQGHSKTPENAL
jgi:hypothetical protein